MHKCEIRKTLTLFCDYASVIKTNLTFYLGQVQNDSMDYCTRAIITRGLYIYSPIFEVHFSQWISLLYRRLQKIEQIEPDHFDRYQKNQIKKSN